MFVCGMVYIGEAWPRAFSCGDRTMSFCPLLKICEQKGASNRWATEGGMDSHRPPLPQGNGQSRWPKHPILLGDSRS